MLNTLGSVFDLGLLMATDSKGEKKGMKVPKDYPKAFKWYRKAADRGHAEAQCGIADMHHSGQGVPRNDIEVAYRRNDLFERRRALMQQWAVFLAGAEKKGIRFDR